MRAPTQSISEVEKLQILTSARKSVKDATSLDDIKAAMLAIIAVIRDDIEDGIPHHLLPDEKTTSYTD